MIRTAFIGLICMVALGGQYRAPVGAPPPPAVAGATTSTRVDALFAQAALGANTKELQEARLALARSQVAEVRGYAEKMIDEHSTLLRQLRSALPHASIPAPTAADRLGTFSMQRLPQPDFDQQYIEGEIGDHLATVGVFSAEAQYGASPVLRKLAASWIPTLQAHLQLAVDLTRHIGGSSPFKSH